MAGAYKPREGDVAWGGCNRTACQYHQRVLWQPKRVAEVGHNCPVPGKVGTVEQRPLKRLYTYEERPR